MMQVAYKTIFAGAIFCVANIAHSIAQPAIEFKETTHQFGEVVEGTQAAHEFEFTNTGTEPLIITRVAASCGCTTPYWTKEPVLPGETGMIKASYNSNGRPGQFRKSITVMSNASLTPNTMVYIMGNVVKRPPTEEEIASSPRVSVAETMAKPGKVEMGKTIPITFEVTNSGKSVLQLKSIRSTCNCILFDPEYDRSIASGETETLTLYYTPQQEGLWVEPIIIYTNDITNPELKLSLEGEVVESLQGEGVGTRRGF